MPPSIADLLNRVGGAGAADRFVVEVSDTQSDVAGSSSRPAETFTISAREGKPCITAATLSAATAGLGYYLNHYAHINISWNQLTTDIAHATLPLPASPETHTCDVPLRYYLNYCTFSYSMSVWTWERWQQEIDWMALHGVNMPLQIVGLDAVWRELLMKHYGYTEQQVAQFIAGPSFQAWWAMNNLEGWGGPNPQWWYERQQLLARRIVEREHELGMMPVLPGFSGMVPAGFSDEAVPQGNWCGFRRPDILNPASETFATMASHYYALMDSLCGPSCFYSMDPFHEGANMTGIDASTAYASIYQALSTAHPDAQWVIQYWQWQPRQYEVLRSVPRGKLIVLDLFADATPHWAEMQGHDVVYCMLHNFGARTGLYGRIPQTMEHYADVRNNYSALVGVGATPEGLGTTPVVYDLLYELPWISSDSPRAKPDTWLSEWVRCRYGQQSSEAEEAWQLLLQSSLDCRSNLQGPVEAVTCARPSAHTDRVSTWGGTEIFYDQTLVARAAQLLRSARLSGSNYNYDLTDITRQAWTDSAYYLLKSIQDYHAAGLPTDAQPVLTWQGGFCNLVLALDTLLRAQPLFNLRHWTDMAAAIADEAAADGLLPASELDEAQRWLVRDNAMRLITTWGPRQASENGGLHDYSYRQWAGMLISFYLPRWQLYFIRPDNAEYQRNWYELEDRWTNEMEIP